MPIHARIVSDNSFSERYSLNEEKTVENRAIISRRIRNKEEVRLESTDKEIRNKKAVNARIVSDNYCSDGKDHSVRTDKGITNKKEVQLSLFTDNRFVLKIISF